jgi:hypothetical protein
MMKKNNISQFMLEMYRLDLASPKERKQVEAALSSDEELRRRYEALAESDQEIRRRYPYPPERMSVPAVKRDARKPGRGVFIRLDERKRLLAGLGAVAVLVCALFFSVLYLRNLFKKPAEVAAARGTENNIKDFSVSIFPLETQAELGGIDYEDGLPDGTLLREGDSILVAYTTPPEGESYGVIFAVNGRPGSDVTLLYGRDRPKLSGGGETLKVKYILEPATDFEMFFLVASQNSLNVEAIIKTANEAAGISAGESGRNPETVLEKMNSAFEGYEVKHSYIKVTK